MTSATNAFRQSRIYAEGWNAARTLSGGIPSPNPYSSEPERSRWQAGFIAASGQEKSPG